MPPRFSLRPLARQLTASMPGSKASISTTNKAAIDLSGPNASRRLLDIDESKTPASSERPASVRGPRNATPGGADGLLRALDRNNGRGFKDLDRNKVANSMKIDQERQDLGQQATRLWKEGDTYAPHDLSFNEMIKWRRPKQPTKDVFDLLGLNPLDHYKNFSIISEYTTKAGRIKANAFTGLRPVNQRKIAKAIRRAIGMGIHPSTHHHPEILYDQPYSGPRYQNAVVDTNQLAKKIQVK